MRTDPEVEMRIAARTAMFLMSMGMIVAPCTKEQEEFAFKEFKERTSGFANASILKNKLEKCGSPLDEAP